MTAKNKMESPRWLERVFSINLGAMTSHQVLVVLRLCQINDLAETTGDWTKPHSYMKKTWVATDRLREMWEQVDFNQAALVGNHQSMNLETACMLLCFAGINWIPQSVSDWLSVSETGGWYQATDALIKRLEEVDYHF